MRKLFLTICVLAAIGLRAASASGHEFSYSASLSGGAEVPANTSPASGTVLVTTDLDIATVRIETTFSGLSGPVIGAQIHGQTATPGAGVADVALVDPLPGFVFGTPSGTYDGTVDLTEASGYTPAFIATSGGTVSDAENAVFFGLDEGRMYFELDTAAFPNGEIRGFLNLVPVPEPTSVGLVFPIAAVLLRRRRKARQRCRF